VISNFEFLMLNVAFNNDIDIRLSGFPLALFIFFGVSHVVDFVYGVAKLQPSLRAYIPSLNDLRTIIGTWGNGEGN